MNDIVERLRAHMLVWPKIADYYAGDALDQAIKEIERYRKATHGMSLDLLAVVIDQYVRKCLTPTTPGPDETPALKAWLANLDAVANLPDES